MKVTIIGSGVYAKAMTTILLKSKCDITMWTEQEDTRAILVPKEIKVTNNFEESIKGAKLIYVLTGSKFCESIFTNIKHFISEEQIIILGSKGILPNGELLTELLEKTISGVHYAVISGPTFAVDIAAGEPLGFTIGTKEKSTFDLISEAMSSVYLEYSADVVAIEMAGSLKNAYAIGSGILTSFNFGNSTRCLYITQALKEISSIFRQIGSNENSTQTLAGLGDLVLTCTSPNSRNYTFGTILSLNSKEERIEYLKNNTVEGYENLKAYNKLFKEKNINAPILSCVYDIVANNVDTSQLIEVLIQNTN